MVEREVLSGRSDQASVGLTPSVQTLQSLLVRPGLRPAGPMSGLCSERRGRFERDPG